MFDTEEERWNAVVARNPAAEGAFVYSVRTTGIFCRPGCGARLPLRKNVAFHAGLAEALTAGFRPCRRCNPGCRALAQEWSEAVAKACRTIEESAVPPSNAALAAAAAMSSSHFQRVFKAATGVTPRGYAAAVRSVRVREGLLEQGSVIDAIYDAGFGSSSRFYAGSSAALGMTPTSYRRGGEGLTVRFGVGDSSLGAVLVAATETGVCAVLIGDDPDALVADLQRRFPNARLLGGDEQFEGWLGSVIAVVEAPGTGVELPLDVRGTAFQHLVWQALQRIPVGSTATYQQIAERIGSPKAARAVAAACAANQVAVLIPCHRVIRTDASLSGYRWGVERKRELLRREAPDS